jgi:threonylcarbamoyladenosine tRNA methylthiotransferase MtaB
MKIFIRGLHSCVMRKTDIAGYKISLRKAGHEIVSEPEDSDVILVWTCAFRQDFRDNSINVLKHYQSSYDKRLIACGCLPSIDSELLQKEFNGEYFEWKNDETAMKELFGADIEKTVNPVIERALPMPIELFKEQNPKFKTTHCDQFLKLFISEGCTFNCSYCAEIVAFPPYRSYPLEELVEQCKRAVRKYDENKVSFFGDCIGEYGKDIGSSLPELIKALIDNIDNIEIGIKNLHPLNFIEYYDDIIEFIKKKHIFLLETPIQSASDPVLELMERRCKKKDLIKIFDGLRECGFKELETHIIVGFPSETEEQFQETVDFICEYKPKWVLVSSFMEAPGRNAVKLKGKIDMKEKQRRVISAYEQISKEGVICNYDNCDLCQDSYAYPRIDELEYE